MTLLEVSGPECLDVYRYRLILVRPDLHVAWSDDEPPARPGDLLASLLGRHDTARQPTPQP